MSLPCVIYAPISSIAVFSFLYKLENIKRKPTNFQLFVSEAVAFAGISLQVKYRLFFTEKAEQRKKKY